jgi:hypothetical protein
MLVVNTSKICYKWTATFQTQGINARVLMKETTAEVQRSCQFGFIEFSGPYVWQGVSRIAGKAGGRQSSISAEINEQFMRSCEV